MGVVAQFEHPAFLLDHFACSACGGGGNGGAESLIGCAHADAMTSSTSVRINRIVGAVTTSARSSQLRCVSATSTNCKISANSQTWVLIPAATWGSNEQEHLPLAVIPSTARDLFLNPLQKPERKQIPRLGLGMTNREGAPFGVLKRD